MRGGRIGSKWHGKVSRILLHEIWPTYPSAIALKSNNGSAHDFQGELNTSKLQQEQQKQEASQTVSA